MIERGKMRGVERNAERGTELNNGQRVTPNFSRISASAWEKKIKYSQLCLQVVDHPTHNLFTHRGFPLKG